MENLVVAMMLPSDVFYARELDKAMKVSSIQVLDRVRGYKRRSQFMLSTFILFQ